MRKTTVLVLSEFSTTDGGDHIHGIPGEYVRLTDEGLKRLEGRVSIPSQPKRKVSKKVEAEPVEAVTGETEE